MTTSLTDITGQIADANAEDRIYAVAGGGHVKIKTWHDTVASTPEAITLRLSAAPCGADGKALSDPAGAPLIHPQRLLVVKASGPATIADDLAALHQDMAREVGIALDNRQQLAALAGIGVVVPPAPEPDPLEPAPAEPDPAEPDSAGEE